MTSDTIRLALFLWDAILAVLSGTTTLILGLVFLPSINRFKNKKLPLTVFPFLNTSSKSSLRVSLFTVGIANIIKPLVWPGSYCVDEPVPSGLILFSCGQETHA